MEPLLTNFFQALWLAWRRKVFWLLGFFQLTGLFLVLSRLNPLWWASPVRVVWFILLLLVFSLASCFLWLRIQAELERKVFSLSLLKFLDRALKVLVFSLTGVILAVLLKAFNVHWTVFALLSVFFSVSLAVGSLAAVLYNLSLAKSCNFIYDFWTHAPSVLFSSSFIVLLANGFFFYLAHSLGIKSAIAMMRFSASPTSATIWVLFLISGLVVAILAAFLNTLVVIVFLSLGKPKKQPEYIKPTEVQPVTA